MIIKFFNEKRELESECKPEFSTFPDGQPHVKVNPVKWDFHIAEIHCSIRNPLELFQLRLVYQVVNQHLPCQIVIYWLFGARMDRAIDSNQPFTFKEVVEMLPAFLPNISFLDIHNPNTVLWSRKIPLDNIVNRVIVDFGESDIYFPDAGALSRYQGLFNSQNCLYGKKKRDSQTGKLSGFEFGAGEKKNNSILIFDDLCDGGKTFLGHYGILKEMGYERIGLYTTHGIYSKGIEALLDFDSIYSTNSFRFGLPIEDGRPTNNTLFLRLWEKKDNFAYTIIPL
jgi:ribose-phosphate pyrophosphokinase